MSPPIRPTITVLCGSTRFSHTFREQNLRLTLAGHIVLSIGCDMRTDADLFADLTPERIEEIKRDLDELHKRKIDLADEALVLNVGGYIGSSTRSEIDYAKAQWKPVRYLEPLATPAAEAVPHRAAGLHAIGSSATTVTLTEPRNPRTVDGCDDCSVEPGETHRWAGCPGAVRQRAREAAQACHHHESLPPGAICKCPKPATPADSDTEAGR